MTPCPRCGGRSRQAFAVTDRNRLTSDEEFRYLRCSACGVIWLDNVPADLGRHYPAGYHGFLDGHQLHAAAAGERPRVALVSAHVTGGRMVEIGPSQGIFAAAAREAGFDVLGLEMDAACCRHLEDVVGVRAVHTDAPGEALTTLPPSRAVVMWHVIEHLPDPWSVLRAIADNLEPGGVLGIATPNPDSLQARLFGSRWVHVDAPRHVTLVPLPALEATTGSLGLRCVSATTSDPVGRQIARMGWERSVVSPPALRPEAPFVAKVGGLVGRAARRWEVQDLRGAAYTAIFQKAA